MVSEPPLEGRGGKECSGKLEARAWMPALLLPLGSPDPVRIVSPPGLFILGKMGIYWAPTTCYRRHVLSFDL